MEARARAMMMMVIARESPKFVVVVRA